MKSETLLMQTRQCFYTVMIAAQNIISSSSTCDPMISSDITVVSCHTWLLTWENNEKYSSIMSNIVSIPGCR